MCAEGGEKTKGTVSVQRVIPELGREGLSGIGISHVMVRWHVVAGFSGHIIWFASL